ncbi:hypothetical protein EJ08DRAFT_142084 [Tothia fuscella]|uniref:Uncharacterized protein n=1 Tax=Tothia fuscella TaxID=1048955 RepID=A0A9P4NV61_9PEZI|nr:hypothetical protein EJ08DRAFT_142084 [Tothia fuscella]
MEKFPYHRHWTFSESDDDVECYALKSSQFDKQPNIEPTAPDPSDTKICVWFTHPHAWSHIGVSRDYMEKIRKGWKVPDKFWRKHFIPEHSAFEIHTDVNSSGELNAVYVGYRILGWIDFHDVLTYYNHTTSQLLVFVQESIPEEMEGLLGFFKSNVDTLRQQPLRFLGLHLNTTTEIIVQDIQVTGFELFQVGLTLMEAKHVEYQKSFGLVPSGQALKDESQTLFNILRSSAHNSRNCDLLEVICDRYRKLSEGLDEKFSLRIDIIDTEEIENENQLAKLEVAYQDRVLQIHSTTLNNRLLQEDTKVSIEIAKASKDAAEAALKDSAALKTVAYLTLAFLPATFVSTIFSTTVIDFGNWGGKDGNDGRVISNGWWIYVISSIGATIMTLWVYFCWNRKVFKLFPFRRKKGDEEGLVEKEEKVVE